MKFAEILEIKNWLKRSRVTTSRGLDWTDKIFLDTLEQDPLVLEKRMVPTIEFIMRTGHFVESAELFCEETSELASAFLLARVCDKGCIRDSSKWLVLQT